MPNYCSIDEAKQIAGQDGNAAFAVQQWWLDDIDALIEDHTGQGYKAATRAFTHRGTGNSIIKLPSVAKTITQVKENGTVLASSEYELAVNGKHLERQPNSALGWWYEGPPLYGYWYRDYKYVVTYTEPDIDEVPSKIRFTAATCVAIVAMFAKKHKEYGVALTAQDAGSAGRVSTASSTSFPASLVEQLRSAIKAALPRGLV